MLTIGGYEFNTNISGQIVAYAVVPEPSTFALVAIGATFLVGGARKRRRRSRREFHVGQAVVPDNSF